MVSIGYFLSSEEFGPRDLVEQARMAEQAGFERLWVSDHFHPWNREQGNSPFVWSVIGALAEATSLPIATAVTCPTMRIHPVIIAQAAATAAVQLEGRFVLGVGSGEALNEHILGDHWPPAAVRLAMLEEAVEVIRALHRGGEVDYRGTHYRVENAQLFTLPDDPVPIYVSGFGSRSAALAGRIGDGFMSVLPESKLVRRFRESGGADRPAQGGFKVCYAPTREQGVETARRLWPNEQVPGELAQVLPTPRHFEQASTLVTPGMVAEAVPCGPDPDAVAARVQSFVDAGYDQVHIQQIGPDQEAFFEFWANEVRPRVHQAVPSGGA